MVLWHAGSSIFIPKKAIASLASHTFLEVSSLDLIWWPDLRWPGTNFSGKVQKWCLITHAKKMVQAAPPPLFFLSSLKNQTGSWHSPTIRAREKRMIEPSMISWTADHNPFQTRKLTRCWTILTSQPGLDQIYIMHIWWSFKQGWLTKKASNKISGKVSSKYVIITQNKKTI